MKMHDSQLQKVDKSITRKDLNHLLNIVFEPTRSRSIDNSIGDDSKKKLNDRSTTKSKADIKSSSREDKPVVEKLSSNRDLTDKKPEVQLNSKSTEQTSTGLKGVKKSSKLDLIMKLKPKRKSVELSIEALNLDSTYFLQHLTNLVNNSVGLKQANPPFDCHPDLLKKYLIKAHKLKNIDEFCDLTQPVLKFIVIDANLFIRKDEFFDPYFKVYSPSNKLSNRHAYTSRHFDKESKPKWNEFFHVPVTRKNIKNHESIRIELWDHDPSTVSGALSDFKNVKGYRSFRKTFKDFFEVLCSGLFRCIQVDDRIGFCLIELDEIPATGIKLTKCILDKNLRERGTIRLNLDWGFLKIKDKKDKMISILMHMKLYSFCLNWHLEQDRTNDTIKELQIEKINYIFLFYKTELTLLNQNRIRGCLTDYEDGIIRRAIIIRTILNLPAEERNSRLLLSSMLVNEDLSRPESLIWIQSDYLIELREFEKHNLNHLVEFYTTRFDAFKCLCFSKEFDCDTLDILQFLRNMVKYENCYPDAQFKEKINLELKNYIINLINESLADPNNWNQLANKLDFLDENLEKYWQRNIRTLLDADGIDKIRNEYERIVYSLVKVKINESKTVKGSNEKFKLDNQLITWYFFCKKFEFIMFDDKRLIRKSSELSVQMKQTDLKANEHSPPKDRKEQSLAQLTDSRSIKQTSNLEIKSDSDLPGESDDEKSEIDLNNLTFCDMVLCKAINPKLRTVFPKHLFISWMNERGDNCMTLSTTIVDEEIKKLIKIVNKLNVKELKANYSTVENYFYEALTETVYFYTSLEYWDEQLFERTIDKLCECLYVFVRNYKKSLTAKHRSLDSKKVNLLISIGINELFRLNDRLLNRILIRILTDLPAEEVWKCIENHRKLIKQKNQADDRSIRSLKKGLKKDTKSKDATKDVKDAKDSKDDTQSTEGSLGKVITKSNEQLIQTLNSSTSKLIVKICFRIKYAFKQIYEIIDELVHHLGKQILKEFENGLNEVLNSKKHSLMLKVIDQLGSNLDKFSSCLISKQTNVDLIVFTKHNLNLNLRIVFIQLVEQYVDETNNEKADRHLTKIKIIKLVAICTKLKEFFKQKVDSYDDETRKLLSRYLTSLFVDTKEFRNLASRLFDH